MHETAAIQTPSPTRTKMSILPRAIDILISKNHLHNNSRRVVLRFNGTKNPFCVVLKEFNPVVNPALGRPIGIEFQFCDGIDAIADGIFQWKDGKSTVLEELAPIYSDPVNRVLDEALLYGTEVVNVINAIAWFNHLVETGSTQFRNSISKMMGESTKYWRPTLFDALHELCISFGKAYGLRTPTIYGEWRGDAQCPDGLTMPYTENEKGGYVPMMMFADSSGFRARGDSGDKAEYYPFDSRQYFKSVSAPEKNDDDESAKQQTLAPYLVKFSDERDARSSGFEPATIYPVAEFCEENGTRYALIERNGEPIYVNAGRLTEVRS